MRVNWAAKTSISSSVVAEQRRSVGSTRGDGLHRPHWAPGPARTLQIRKGGIYIYIYTGLGLSKSKSAMCFLENIGRQICIFSWSKNSCLIYIILCSYCCDLWIFVWRPLPRSHKVVPVGLPAFSFTKQKGNSEPHTIVSVLLLSMINYSLWVYMTL